MILTERKDIRRFLIGFFGEWGADIIVVPFDEVTMIDLITMIIYKSYLLMIGLIVRQIILLLIIFSISWDICIVMMDQHYSK